MLVIMMIFRETYGRNGVIRAILKVTIYPSRIPSMPPVTLRMIASRRNCNMMFEAEAPTAFLMPISRVRSETVTSMIFMIPIPPMKRATPATRVSIPDITENMDPLA